MKKGTAAKTGFRFGGSCKDDGVRTDLKYMAVLFVVTGFSCMIIFREYLFGGRLMIFNDIGSDTWQQYIMYYSSIVEHLRSGTFSFWDFTNGLGTNVFNYNLFDPFLMLLYAIGVVLGPAHMLLYINYIQILKILLAGVSCFWFLSRFRWLSARARFMAAYVYAFNGYLLLWGQHYHFGTAVVYLPLLLGFCERFVRGERHRHLFAVMVFFCSIYSVYFSYMCLAATGLYLLVRVMIPENLSAGERLRIFIGGCCEILLGVGMGLAAFLPSAETILNVSSRVSSGSVSGSGSLVDRIVQCFTHYSPEFYISFLKRMFSGNLQNGYGLVNGPQDYVMNYYEDPVLFCSALAVFFNAQLPVVLRRSELPKRTKRVLGVTAALITAAVLFHTAGTVFNFFVSPSQRYTFVLMPFFVLLMAWMWDYLKKGGKLNLFLILAVSILMGWAYYEGYEQAGFAEHKRNIILLSITGAVLALSLILLNHLKKQQFRNLVMAVMAGALAVNVLSDSAADYQARVTMMDTDTPLEEMEALTEQTGEEEISEDKETKYRADLDRPQDFFRQMYRSDLQDALEYLAEKDSTFYRVEKDYISGTVAMDSMAQGYRGISTYNSVMNSYVKEFVETCAPELFYADRNHYVFWDNVQDNSLAAFLGIKYILSGDGNPDGTSWKLLKKVQGLYIHENVKEASTAHFYGAAISEDSLKKLCTEETRDDLLTGAVALEDGEDIEDVSEIKELLTEDDKEAAEQSEVILDTPEKDSLITGEIHAKTDGYALFMIPWEDGWSLEIDGEKAELLRGDIGFLACRVTTGDHTLKLTFCAPGLKAGIAGSMVSWGAFAFVLYVGKRKRRDPETTARLREKNGKGEG